MNEQLSTEIIYGMILAGAKRVIVNESELNQLIIQDELKESNKLRTLAIVHSSSDKVAHNFEAYLTKQTGIKPLFPQISKSLLVLASILCVTSCAVNAPVVGSGKVSYGDANAVETINTDFGSTDLNMVAQNMADDLIKNAALNSCKTFTVSSVRNKTDQYIDAENITQSIKTRLMRAKGSITAKYVLSAAQMQNQTDELSRQNNTGLYKNPSQIGNMQAAECRIDGFISSISKANSDMKDVFYQFNLSLVNVKEGTELWSNEKQIRKTIVK